MGRRSSARTRGGAEDGSEPAPADATGQRNIFRAAKAVAVDLVSGSRAPAAAWVRGSRSVGQHRWRRAVAGLVPARAARAAVLHRRPPRSLSRRAARVGPRIRARRVRAAGPRRPSSRGPWAGGVACRPYKFRCSACRSWRAWRSSAELLARSLAGYRRSARRARTRDARRRRAARGDPGQAAARRRAAAAAAAARRWRRRRRVEIRARRCAFAAGAAAPAAADAGGGGGARDAEGARAAARRAATLGQGLNESRYSRNYADEYTKQHALIAIRTPRLGLGIRPCVRRT